MTFFLSYLNSGLFATEAPNKMQYLSVAWFSTFSTTVLSALIMTNLAPYIGVLIDLIINKWIRKRKRSENYYEFERKNAQILSSIFIAFTYGFGLPLIFGYLLIPLIVFSYVDRWLIVYWSKPQVLQTDLLTITFLRIVLFAPCLYLLFASLSLYFASSMWLTETEVL